MQLSEHPLQVLTPLITYRIVEFGQVLKQVPFPGKSAKDPLQDRQDVEETHNLHGVWHAEQVNVLLFA